MKARVSLAFFCKTGMTIEGQQDMPGSQSGKWLSARRPPQGGLQERMVQEVTLLRVHQKGDSSLWPTAHFTYSAGVANPIMKCAPTSVILKLTGVTGEVLVFASGVSFGYVFLGSSSL